MQKQRTWHSTHLCFLCCFFFLSRLPFSCDWKSEDSGLPRTQSVWVISTTATNCIPGNWFLHQKLSRVASRGRRHHGGFLPRCCLHSPARTCVPCFLHSVLHAWMQTKQGLSPIKWFVIPSIFFLSFRFFSYKRGSVCRTWWGTAWEKQRHVQRRLVWSI